MSCVFKENSVHLWCWNVPPPLSPIPRGRFTLFLPHIWGSCPFINVQYFIDIHTLYIRWDYYMMTCYLQEKIIKYICYKYIWVYVKYQHFLCVQNTKFTQARKGLRNNIILCEIKHFWSMHLCTMFLLL